MTTNISASPALPTNNLLAIWLMIIAMSTFALTDSLIRLASLVADGGASAGQLLATQGVLGVIIFSARMRLRGERLKLSDLANRVVVARTMSDITAATCIMTALTLISVGEVSAILQVQPLVVTLGAALFLKEAVGVFRWSAILVGFIGVMIIMRPGAGQFDPASIVVLIGVLGLAARDLLTRKIPPGISTSAITVIVSAAIVPAGITLHWFLGQIKTSTAWLDLPPITIAYGLISSLCAIVGYFILTQAMRLGEISAVAPYRYTRLLAAFFFSWLILSERPDSFTILGSAIVVAAGIFAVFRERKLQQKTR